jgi:hypothetical protein
MRADDLIPRLLGVAFLGVIVTSLVSGGAMTAATGHGTMSDILVSVASNAGPMRLAVLMGLMNAVGILVLAILLFVVLRDPQSMFPTTTGNGQQEHAASLDRLPIRPDQQADPAQREGAG